MNRWLSVLCAWLAALGLPACDGIGMKALKPGVSTAYEVRERMGAPTMEWKNLDGTRTWEYARQPQGHENFMLVIGPDDMLREIRQVLTEENFARVERGYTEEQIRRLLGRPARIAPLPLKRETVWDWRVKTPFGHDQFWHVHFGEDGKVVGVSRTDDLRH